MSGQRNALLTGIFILAAIATIVVAVVLLSGGKLFGNQLRAVVYFEGSVRGLYIGAPVTFRGVKVGEVGSIGIDVDPATLATRIPVGLSIGSGSIHMGGADNEHVRDLPDLVKRGLRAKLVLQSVVTGQTGIDLDFKPNTPAHLLAQGPSKVPEIPAMRDKLDALVEQISNLPLSELVSQLRETIGAMQQTFQASQSAIDKTGTQLNATAIQAQKTLIVAAQAMQNLQAQSGATLTSITRLSDTSRDVVLRTQPELVRTLQSTREAAQVAQEAMVNLTELSAPGAPLRADLEASMRDLSQATRSLRAFSEQLERQPNSLLFGKRTEP